MDSKRKHSAAKAGRKNKMTDKTKNILKIIITAAVTILLTYFGLQLQNAGGGDVVSKDTTSTVKIEETVQYKYFYAWLKAKIEAELLDSLKGTIKPELITIYESVNYNLDSLIAGAKREALAGVEDVNKQYVFTSTRDTNYVVKDSLGRTRDSVAVQSKFVSPIPLHSASWHFVKIEHQSFGYDTNTETTIKEKSLWNSIRPGLIAAYGYGIKTNKWDLFVGAGANIDIQELLKIIQE